MIKNKLKISIQKIVNIFSVGGILFLIIYMLFMNNDKIAYVDSSKIMNEYKGAVEAKKIYEKKMKSWQSNVDTLALDLQGSIKKYEKDLAGMSPKETELSKQLIGTKQKQLADYQKAIQENARQEDAKLFQGIVSEVNGFLLKYGKKHNYKIILIANQSGTIAYAREGLDITTKVVEELNSGDIKN